MSDTAIQLAEAPDGTLSYAVPLPPESLPAVTPAALLAAWDAARAHAQGGSWGPVRRLLFRTAEGGGTVLLIADRDARSWAEAVDRRAGLATLPGLALCLRLLALVEVMGRSAWMAGLFVVARDGVELHPALLRAACVLPLDSGGRFDAEALRALVSRTLPGARVPA
ncbi:hypothetical protein [Falsiroseomonas selenitidurans]|uniref:Uncharacterized protein n=1 Tax=Falsiroseomonas selenitidurans TaxID=2716335 RepID=A0ABX1E4F0_9PROT|nr:hypothetical protein [Falsiroseomonas selenitidurans]NKC31575.1 hypothetical protein [Falsiroseomonas selenitidurans]